MLSARCLALNLPVQLNPTPRAGNGDYREYRRAFIPLRYPYGAAESDSG